MTPELPTREAYEMAIHKWEPVADFWKLQERALPVKSRLARKHLAAPSSSVYSERLFSEFGSIYEEKRSKTSTNYWRAPPLPPSQLQALG